MKILYNPIRKKSEEIEYEIMKVMLNDIILNRKITECFPAMIPPDNGIFCKTSENGKKFWTFKELSYYFAKKNGELQRITDENLQQLRK